VNPSDASENPNRLPKVDTTRHEGNIQLPPNSDYAQTNHMFELEKLPRPATLKGSYNTPLRIMEDNHMTKFLEDDTDCVLTKLIIFLDL